MFTSARTRPYPRRLNLEPLEDRTLLSTCTVDTLADTGSGAGWAGDLRYCITKVNTEPGPDAIGFTVTGTINLTGVLPDLTSDMDIVGPGANQLTVRRDTGGGYRIFRVNTGATVELSGLTITNGRPTGSNKTAWGGGIYNTGTLTISASAVTNNGSDASDFASRGGGIYSDGSLTVVDSTVSSNFASGADSSRGGGIFSRGALTIRNTTIANNFATAGCGLQAFAQGGGIENESGTFVLTNSTISGNAASCSAGGIAGGVSSILNTIVSGNTANSNPNCSCSGPFNIIGGNAMLGPLAPNGGPTPTMALNPGSPAINAGDNTDAPEWDQRGPGYPRIVNGTVDIGAFEVFAEGVYVVNTNDDGPGSLREAIVDANANPGVDTITFAINTGPKTIAPLSPLPAITDTVIIDGTTQPGYAGGPMIEIWGGGAGPNADGLTLASDNSIVKGLLVNLFSGNGILITGNGNQVATSFIGVDFSGTFPVPNALSGVEISGGSNNTIGGSAGAGNLIANNGDRGVLVDTGTGNIIQQNGIHSNGGLGIALTNGGNNNQAKPSVNAATSGGGSTTITVTLVSTPNTTYTIEFFDNAVCDPSTFGEGESYLGSKNLTTKETGRGRTVFVVGVEVPVGHQITATATSPLDDTSEFAKCRTVTAGAAPGGGAGEGKTPAIPVDVRIPMPALKRPPLLTRDVAQRHLVSHTAAEQHQEHAQPPSVNRRVSLLPGHEDPLNEWSQDLFFASWQYLSRK